MTTLPAPEPSPEPSPELVIPPEPSADGARDLAATVECSQEPPRQAVAHLQWSPAPTPGSEQRVVVSLFRDGFSTGDYALSDALAPGQSGLDWTQVQGDALHFWKVLTLREGQWLASETALFQGLSCPTDYQPPAPPSP